MKLPMGDPEQDPEVPPPTPKNVEKIQAGIDPGAEWTNAGMVKPARTDDPGIFRRSEGASGRRSLILMSTYQGQSPMPRAKRE
jgi:hypothetical protein